MTDENRQTGRTTRMMDRLAEHESSLAIFATHREAREWAQRYPGVRCMSAYELTLGRTRGQRFTRIEVDHHVGEDGPTPGGFWDELEWLRATIELAARPDTSSLT